MQGKTGSDCFVTTGDRFDSLLGVWVRAVTELGSAVGRGKWSHRSFQTICGSVILSVLCACVWLCLQLTGT